MYLFRYEPHLVDSSCVLSIKRDSKCASWLMLLLSCTYFLATWFYIWHFCGCKKPKYKLYCLCSLSKYSPSNFIHAFQSVSLPCMEALLMTSWLFTWFLEISSFGNKKAMVSNLVSGMDILTARNPYTENALHDGTHPLKDVFQWIAAVNFSKFGR